MGGLNWGDRPARTASERAERRPRARADRADDGTIDLDALAGERPSLSVHPGARPHRRAVVERVDDTTVEGTVRLAFQVADERPFHFEPGQFASMQFEGPDGTTLRSPYCILSPPGDDGRFELLVRVVGPVSRRLAALVPGESVSFRGPLGRAIRPTDDDRVLVLLATGVGVAPFHSYVAHLQATGRMRPVRLYWGVRRAADLCLLEELRDLAAADDDFTFAVTLSEPPPGWRGLRGRITESVPPLLETLGDKDFYLCGNGAMIQEMTTALSDMGVARRFLHEEAYFNGRHVPPPDVLAAIRSRFVADDMFSPFAHLEAGLFVGRQPSGPVAGNVDPRARTDVRQIKPWDPTTRRATDRTTRTTRTTPTTPTTPTGSDP